MKKLLLIVLIAFGINANAQIVFEHDYDSASTCSSGNPALADQLELIHFEISGDRYVKISRHQKKILIYNLNHSLLKTIDFSNFPQTSPMSNWNYFLYFSESLFDTDSAIEFMYVTNASGLYTGIYKENGTLIFSDTAAPLIFQSFPSQQYPIYNTSQGTKMILSYTNGHAKVFGLPGTLTTAIQETNNNLLAHSSISNPYPNPTNNTTRVDYTLPQGVNQGEIVFYDLQGRELKRFKVDRTFDHLLISTSDISAGTYFYQLQTNSQTSEGKKLVVIK